MKIHNIEIPIYAETPEEVEAFRNSWVAFVNELRGYNCLVTADRIAQVIPQWKANILIKNRIVEHFKV